MKSKTPLLLTIDAFGTLFVPREPIAKQYGEIARRHGLVGLSNEEVGTSFRKAFKEQSVQHPNYGKAVGMKTNEWWCNVIISTFRPLTSAILPSGLVQQLLTRFSSADGYKLYPDVLPLFQALRAQKQQSSNKPRLLLGILSNSDDRVPLILASLGLKVSPWRLGKEAERVHSDPEVNHDIHFVALSYDIGFEKPDKRLFDATKEMANVYKDANMKCIHIGDDMEKDYQGAEAAGWMGVLLDRNEEHTSHKINRIRDLSGVLMLSELSAILEDLPPSSVMDVAKG